MRIEEILNIELDGITKTICDYTHENFITSYTEKLKSLIYPKDKRWVQLIVAELIKWYEANMNEIMDNNYIVNKKEHQKSYILLKEMSNILEKA